MTVLGHFSFSELSDRPLFSKSRRLNILLFIYIATITVLLAGFIIQPGLALTELDQATEIEAFSRYLQLYSEAEKATSTEEATAVIEKFMPLIADGSGSVPDHVKAHSLIAVGQLYEDVLRDHQTAYLAYTQASQVSSATSPASSAVQAATAAKAVALEKMASMEKRGIIDADTGNYTFVERYKREFLPTFGWKGAGPIADKAVALSGLTGRHATIAKFLSTFAWVAGSNAGSGVVDGSLQGIDDITDVMAESAVDSMGRTVGDDLVEKTARKSVENMSYGKQLASFGAETAAMAGSRILAEAGVDMYKDYKSGQGVDISKSFAQVDYKNIAGGSAGWVSGSMVGKAAGAMVGGLLGTMVGCPALGAVIGSSAVGRMGGVVGMAVGEAFAEESKKENPDYWSAIKSLDYGKMAARAAAAVTVGMGASALGKIAGGAIGGVVGTLICPGAGTAMGATVGSFIGGVLGDVAGFVAGGALADTLVDKYRASRNGRKTTLEGTETAQVTDQQALLKKRANEAYYKYISLMDSEGPSSEATASAFEEYRDAITAARAAAATAESAD